jgi:hypothetical protein
MAQSSRQEQLREADHPDVAPIQKVGFIDLDSPFRIIGLRSRTEVGVRSGKIFGFHTHSVLSILAGNLDLGTLDGHERWLRIG